MKTYILWTGLDLNHFISLACRLRTTFEVSPDCYDRWSFTVKGEVAPKFDEALPPAYIDDPELAPDALDCKYNQDGDGEHPGYGRDEWRAAVADKDTISGYWVWVNHCLLEELA